MVALPAGCQKSQKIAIAARAVETRARCAPWTEMVPLDFPVAWRLFSDVPCNAKTSHDVCAPYPFGAWCSDLPGCKHPRMVLHTRDDGVPLPPLHVASNVQRHLRDASELGPAHSTCSLSATRRRRCCSSSCSGGSTVGFESRSGR